jgi:hypothetical protein
MFTALAQPAQRALNAQLAADVSWSQPAITAREARPARSTTGARRASTSEGQVDPTLADRVAWYKTLEKELQRRCDPGSPAVAIATNVVQPKVSTEQLARSIRP